MTPTFFRNQDEFRRWLKKNHRSKKELIVGYYKTHTSLPSMTWSESVDVALCFGWIDGIRRSIDKERYCIRFTPRKPGSTWSRVNIGKVEELTGKGLMEQAGLDIYNKRKVTGIYSFENEPATLHKEYEKSFRAHKAAWEFFMKQAPSYRKNILNWIMSAKQEKTRIARLGRAIAASEGQKKIY
jgi:uncharacterized protein YdeI (YjbR/CyaY-like superfamily)